MRRRYVQPRVGCSGWNYKSWQGRFYPRGLAPDRWLSYYAERFDTVEVNNTFYRLPERHTFDVWRARVPRNFLIAVKASRFLTHMKRLKEPEEPLRRLFPELRRSIASSALCCTSCLAVSRWTCTAWIRSSRRCRGSGVVGDYST